MKNTIKVGVSSCLLGEETRYDGTHKRDHFIADVLGKWVTFVPLCPEVECGFGIPREPLRLVGGLEATTLMTSITKGDYTQSMLRWARKRALALKKKGLGGFIFKSKSPSCGVRKVKIYRENGLAIPKGEGIFVKIFREHFPFMPIEDEEGIHDPKAFKNFIDKVFIFTRWRESLEQGLNREKLIKFHSQHKFLFLSHSPKQVRMMEDLIGKPQRFHHKELVDHYQAILMCLLQQEATAEKHANIMMVIAEKLASYLSSKDNEKLHDLIDFFVRGLVFHRVPLTLLNHYARKYKLSFLKNQAYLDPTLMKLKGLKED